MRYKIKNTLIPEVWFQDKLSATFDLHEADRDLSESPLIEFYRYHRDSWRHESCAYPSDMEASIHERQERVLELYESFKENGYTGSLFLCWFRDDGRIFLYDGFHRLAIMRHLGIEADIEVETDWEGINGHISRDFPLRKMLTLPSGRVRVYQPIDDERVKDIPVERKDTQERSEWIMEHLAKGSVLDIGCSEGFFTRALLREGYRVISVDTDPKLVAVARYLTTTSNLKGDYRDGMWQDLIKDSGHFDNILYLSVLHNEINSLGEEEAFASLALLRDKSNRLFVEIPSIETQSDWAHIFGIEKIIPRLENVLGMAIRDSYKGWRPMYLFTPSSKVHPAVPIQAKATTLIENVLGKHTLRFPTNDYFIAPYLKQHGIWEENTTLFIQKHLKPGQTFLDIGAQVGYFSVLASELVGDKGKIIAFEPAKDNHDLLVENLSRNGCTNVKVSLLALSDKSGEATLNRSTDAGGHSLEKPETPNGKTEQVQVERLDDVLDIQKKMKDEMVWIKIDVEGAERQVLEGMSDILKRDKPLTLIFEDWLEKDTGITEWLTKEYGFREVMRSHADGTVAMVKNAPQVTRHKEKLVCHLIGNVDIPTVKGGVDAFGTKIAYLGRMLKDMGHRVFFYGVEGSDVPCDEFIQTLDAWDLREAYGTEWESGHKMQRHDKIHNLFNKNTTREIKKRRGRCDLLLLSAGLNHQRITEQAGIGLAVEIGIGYVGSFAPYRVYESYAWMHFTHGKQGMDNGRFCDCVIPAFFDPDDFTYSAEKEGYYLYLGRIVHRKGVKIAIDTVEAIGGKLKLIGPQSEAVPLDSPVVEYLGVVSVEEKRRLLSKAKAVFAPTQYLEPFGYVVIEAALSGTPVITTDFGAFTETIRHGVTGYRCRTFEQFIWAAKNIGRIRPQDCRAWGMNFSLEATAPRYEEYFEQLLNLYGKGWYTRNPDREDLSGMGFPGGESKKREAEPCWWATKYKEDDSEIDGVEGPAGPPLEER